MSETAPKPLVTRGTGNKRSDAKPWVPGLLNLIRSLRIRADVWDDLEAYLMSNPDATYEGLIEYSHALQVKVFSHVDQALTPSADKTCTGSLDSFARVILIATELLSSDDFESCEFSLEKMLPCCDQLGPGARDAFEVLDTLRTFSGTTYCDIGIIGVHHPTAGISPCSPRNSVCVHERASASPFELLGPSPAPRSARFELREAGVWDPTSDGYQEATIVAMGPQQ